MRIKNTLLILGALSLTIASSSYAAESIKKIVIDKVQSMTKTVSQNECEKIMLTHTKQTGKNLQSYVDVSSGYRLSLPLKKVGEGQFSDKKYTTLFLANSVITIANKQVNIPTYIISVSDSKDGLPMPKGFIFNEYCSATYHAS